MHQVWVSWAEFLWIINCHVSKMAGDFATICHLLGKWVSSSLQYIGWQWAKAVSNHVFNPLGPTISMRTIKRSEYGRSRFIVYFYFERRECGRSRFIVLFLFSYLKERMWKE
ncbi:hypothetical protein AMTRI_Chr02g256370 [Amborella trichopoda]